MCWVTGLVDEAQGGCHVRMFVGLDFLCGGACVPVMGEIIPHVALLAALHEQNAKVRVWGRRCKYGWVVERPGRVHNVYFEVAAGGRWLRWQVGMQGARRSNR